MTRIITENMQKLARKIHRLNHTIDHDGRFGSVAEEHGDLQIAAHALADLIIAQALLEAEND